MKRYVLFSFGSIFLLAIFEFIGVLRPVRAAGEELLTPAMSFGTQVVSDVELPYFVVRSSLANYQHVQDLELRYAEVSAQLGEVQQLRAENTELKNLLEKNPNGQSAGNSTANSHSHQLIASILSYSQPYIGRGNADGISEGDLVMIQGTIIGRIGQVSASQSEVILLQSSISTPLLVKTDSGVTGVAAGDDKEVIIKELPADAQVKIGDLVVTAGQVGVAPGLAIGRLKSMGTQLGSSTQTAVVDPGISFYQSHIVEVIKE